jgi:hypothetical protein
MIKPSNFTGAPGDISILRRLTHLICGARSCFEECRGLCRLECVGRSVGDQIVATATHFSSAADLPCWHTVLSEDQQHQLPDIGPNGGLGPQGRQRSPFDVGHLFSLKK